MFRRSLLLTVAIVVTTASTVPARAQPAAFSGDASPGVVADTWLTSAVRSEESLHDVGRYIALGVYVVLGGFLLVAPPLIANGRADIGWGGAAVSMGAGALMLSAAATSVFVSERHAAQRWSTSLGLLGAVGMSAALTVSSLAAGRYLPELTGREDSGQRPGTLSNVYGIGLLLGLSCLGYTLSALIVDRALPLPSAIALRSELATLEPDERYGRVREYFQRRDQRRAWEAYTGVAATWLVGGIAWSAASFSNSQGARNAGALSGLTMIISGIGSLISYWVSDSEVARLDAGELPH
jgi:hypothetical protein